jgi:hypothetical protein
VSLSPDVFAVHLTQLDGPDNEDPGKSLRQAWRSKVEEPARRAGIQPPRLSIIPAGRRIIYEPLLKFAQELDAKFGSRRIVVLIPEVVKRRWYQHVLHVHHASRLRRALLAYGAPRLTVMSVPWYVD